MKLEEYLSDSGISMAFFSRKVEVSVQTIQNICNYKNDLRLSIALRIEKETKGQVTCKELLPMRFLEDQVQKDTVSQGGSKDKNNKKRKQEKSKNGSEIRKIM